MADAAVLKLRRAGRQVDAEFLCCRLRLHSRTGRGCCVGTANRGISGAGLVSALVVVVISADLIGVSGRVIAFVHTCTLQHGTYINPAAMTVAPTSTPQQL